MAGLQLLFVYVMAWGVGNDSCGSIALGCAQDAQDMDPVKR